MRNVKDYGAIGDGVTLDTAAFQKAIDAGGMVYVPEGEYIVGTLYLKSNGGLHLALGSVLKGSHRREDYNSDDFCVQNRVFSEELVTGAHLIVAVEQENIIIEGHGTIDGQGNYWMNDKNTIPGYPVVENRDYKPNPERPGQMLFFCECENIHISDVNIVNGPYWHLFLHGCTRATLHGLKIRGDRPRWTNDGIDLDCCSEVTVSDCIIDVGDDALTLRGYDEPLKEKKPCEKITVTNCILRSHRDYGIRIGVGAGTIRNCIISNCDIEAPNNCGLGIMGRWSAESKYATSVEDLLCYGLNIRSDRSLELVLAFGDEPLPNECHICNIKLSCLNLLSDKSIRLLGFQKEHLKNISLSDITLKHKIGAPLTVEYADNVVISSFRSDNEECEILTENCTKVYLDGKTI